MRLAAVRRGEEGGEEERGGGVSLEQIRERERTVRWVFNGLRLRFSFRD